MSGDLGIDYSIVGGRYFPKSKRQKGVVVQHSLFGKLIEILFRIYVLVLFLISCAMFVGLVVHVVTNIIS
ncbi:hypothetical protein MNBD_ALPHA08-476 [hydrothermal vent metagenome]|uniref:Uncharacterized protein n=1 Tax=hydrothermal vent metagenome TaxID=652676 RepID=A0A3B0RE11_9ZZZZ